MENNIKKQELRLGNWVDLLDFVCELNENNLTSILKDKYECYPIPLTEEWLLKFGFEKKKDYYNRYYFSIDEMNIRIDDDMFETEVGECLYKTIKYVHQLQNLYFALNDEELTMK